MEAIKSKREQAVVPLRQKSQQLKDQLDLVTNQIESTEKLRNARRNSEIVLLATSPSQNESLSQRERLGSTCNLNLDLSNIPEPNINYVQSKKSI